jgi:uncharacterized transporter YbjL
VPPISHEYLRTLLRANPLAVQLMSVVDTCVSMAERIRGYVTGSITGDTVFVAGLQTHSNQEQRAQVSVTYCIAHVLCFPTCVIIGSSIARCVGVVHTRM